MSIFRHHFLSSIFLSIRSTLYDSKVIFGGLRDLQSTCASFSLALEVFLARCSKLSLTADFGRFSWFSVVIRVETASPFSRVFCVSDFSILRSVTLSLSVCVIRVLDSATATNYLIIDEWAIVLQQPRLRGNPFDDLLWVAALFTTSFISHSPIHSFIVQQWWW